MKESYKVLGIAEDASYEEIKKAYRDNITLYHPDNLIGKSASVVALAEERFKEVQKAYEDIMKMKQEEKGLGDDKTETKSSAKEDAYKEESTEDGDHFDTIKNIYIIKEPNIVFFILALLLQFICLVLIVQNEYMRYGTGLFDSDRAWLDYVPFIVFAGALAIRDRGGLSILLFIIFLVGGTVSNGIVLILMFMLYTWIKGNMLIKDTSLVYALPLLLMMLEWGVLDVVRNYGDFILSSISVSRGAMYFVYLIEILALMFVMYGLEYNRFVQKNNAEKYSFLKKDNRLITDDDPDHVPVTFIKCSGILIFVKIFTMIVRVSNKDLFIVFNDMEIIVGLIVSLIISILFWSLNPVLRYVKKGDKWIREEDSYKDSNNKKAD